MNAVKRHRYIIIITWKIGSVDVQVNFTANDWWVQADRLEINSLYKKITMNGKLLCEPLQDRGISRYLLNKCEFTLPANVKKYFQIISVHVQHCHCGIFYQLSKRFISAKMQCMHMYLHVYEFATIVSEDDYRWTNWFKKNVNYKFCYWFFWAAPNAFFNFAI